MSEGKLIVFEGIDGGGKSTQIDLLSRQLVNNVVLRSLSSEPIGPEVEYILKKFRPKDRTEALLFASARRYNHDKYITPYLAFKTVICDRYLMDGFAYSCNKQVGMEERFLKNINPDFTKPDITFLLDIDPEISLARIKGPIDHFEKVDFLRLVREKYLNLAVRPTQYFKDQNWIVLDGSKPVNVIQSQVWEEVQKIL